MLKKLKLSNVPSIPMTYRITYFCTNFYENKVEPAMLNGSIFQKNHYNIIIK